MKELIVLAQLLLSEVGFQGGQGRGFQPEGSGCSMLRCSGIDLSTLQIYIFHSQPGNFYGPEPSIPDHTLGQSILRRSSTDDFVYVLQPGILWIGSTLSYTGFSQRRPRDLR